MFMILLLTNITAVLARKHTSGTLAQFKAKCDGVGGTVKCCEDGSNSPLLGCTVVS